MFKIYNFSSDAIRSITEQARQDSPFTSPLISRKWEMPPVTVTKRIKSCSYCGQQWPRSVKRILVPKWQKPYTLAWSSPTAVLRIVYLTNKHFKKIQKSLQTVSAATKFHGKHKSIVKSNNKTPYHNTSVIISTRYSTVSLIRTLILKANKAFIIL
jgi:hypothetical protein